MRHSNSTSKRYHKKHHRTGARGRTSRVTAAQRRRAAETRARRAARKRRRKLADKLAEDDKAVQEYMDKYYSYDSDDEYYPREWQKRYNL